MPSVATLDRRLTRLETDVRHAPEDWRLTYLAALPDEEQEAELDWINPSLFRSWIRGGQCYDSGPLSSDSPLAADPDFEGVWRRWCERYHGLTHEWSMGRLAPEAAPRHLFDFWTVRGDAEQEQMRQELVRRMVAVFAALDCNPEDCPLTHWRPSSPEACTTYPSAAYYHWQDEQNSAARWNRRAR